jgi:hypothetical protein
MAPRPNKGIALHTVVRRGQCKTAGVPAQNSKEASFIVARELKCRDTVKSVLDACLIETSSCRINSSSLEGALGGIYISCGAFAGQDKSGSALEGVLAGMHPIAGKYALAAITRLKASLETASSHALIAPDDAAALLPCLRRYRTELEQLISPVRDPFVAMRNDELADGLDFAAAKYGKGKGWQYYCVLDLEQAFEISFRQQQPVVLTWD